MSKYTHDPLAKFRTCPKCGTDIMNLIVGGIGDWRNTIVCTKCHKIQRGLPYNEVIVPLAAVRYSVSEIRILKADHVSQDEFERVVLGGPSTPDMPVVTVQARWLSRRLVKSLQ